MLCSSEFSQIHKFYKTILLLMLSFQDAKHDCKIWFASNCIAFLMRLFCYWCNIHSSLNKNGSLSDWMLKLTFAVSRFLFGISWMPFVVREYVSKSAAGERTRRSLGHHLLHPLILWFLVLCELSVLRPRALKDAPAPADPNS